MGWVKGGGRENRQGTFLDNWASRRVRHGSLVRQVVRDRCGSLFEAGQCLVTLVGVKSNHVTNFAEG